MASKNEPHWSKPFLKEHQSFFYFLFIGWLVFGFIFVAADLPMTFFFYGVQVQALIFIIWLVFRGVNYRTKFNQLKRLKKFPIDQLSALDLSTTAVEEMYEKEIHQLVQQMKRIDQEFYAKQSDQLDYFTLWLHQIKTPIASISLMLQQNREELAVAKEIEKELVRIEDYTHMALGYMKLEQPGEEMHLEKISLDFVIKRVIKKYALLFVTKKIFLDYTPIEKEIVTDAQWLELLLEQLISNSLKYTPEKGTIGVSWEGEHLVIKDNGIGIRSEDIPKIFEKGYSGWNARRAEKSTGLGLFLSRKIAKRLGYHLTVESKVNEGTTMYLHLKQDAIEVYN